MSELIDKINTLEKKVNDNKIEQAKLEERKETLEEERKEILEKLKEFDIDEEDLEIKIIDMETELDKEIKKIENELK
ncbi:MAG: hypothetical protein ACTSWG_10290 [Candidatus Helarchaeota archaeon]